MNKDGTLDVTNRYQEILDKSVKVEQGMSVQDFKPAPKHILVKIFPSDQKMGKLGLLVAPTIAQQKKQCAVVISVADDVEFLAVGDVVLIDELCGVPVTIGDEEYEVVMSDSKMGGNVLGKWARKVVDNVVKSE